MSRGGLPPVWSVRRWLFTTNHKDIGVLYIVTSLYFLVAAGVLALLVRAQLFAPENNFLAAGPFNQAVTVHGLIMILWFLSPFAFGFANYFVPLQIGARDLAFPRLNALSYWLYSLSGVLLLSSFYFGAAPDVGWTFYAPLTAKRFTPFSGFDIAATALIMLVVSATISTVNFIVTILRSRAPGLKLRNMPLFTWGMFVTVIMMLFAFPSLLAALIMLFSDRALGTLYFASTEGGSLLWDHAFWFFGHPEVYIVLFPAIGAIGDILTTFSRKPLYGRKYVVGAMFAAAIISFIVWGHHMFVTGMSLDVRKFFTVTTVLVSLPFDVMTIAFIETLVGGKIRLTTPALFVIGSIALFVIGGITGVFNASIALDYGLRGTYWVVAHFHYVMVGGSAIALLGALYYWYPKMTGRMYSETLGKIHFITSMVGFNLLYFPMFFLLDMPRRVVTYATDTGWGFWNSVATIGGFLFGLSQLLFFANLLTSLRTGPPAGANPWKGWTLEWSIPSPPPIHNFDEVPVMTDKGLAHVPALTGFQGGAEAGRVQSALETHETHTSPWPIMLALSAFVFFFGLALGLPVLLLGVALGVISLGGYGREKFVAHELPVGERWPFEKIERLKLGVWGFLASEVVMFGALIGAYLFVRLNSAVWPAPGEMLGISHGALNTVLLITSSGSAVLALAAAREGDRGMLLGGLLLTLGLGSAFLANKASEWAELFARGFTFSSGIPETAYYVTTGVHGAHVAAGLAILAYLITKTVRGHYTKDNHKTIEHFGLYWHFVDIVWVFLFPLFYLL